MPRLTTAEKHRLALAVPYPFQKAPTSVFPLPDMAARLTKRMRYLRKPFQQKAAMYEVAQARTCGLTTREIAYQLGLSQGQIVKVLAKVEQMDKLEFNFQATDYLVKRFWISCQLRVSELWKLHDTTSDGELKLKCLTAVHAVEQDMLKMAQDAGLMKKDDAEAADVAYFDFRSVDPDRLSQLTEAMRSLSTQLGSLGREANPGVVFRESAPEESASGSVPPHALVPASGDADGG